MKVEIWVVRRKVETLFEISQFLNCEVKKYILKPSQISQLLLIFATKFQWI
jgi:hypothetical protein